jgi:hypothetical protein
MAQIDASIPLGIRPMQVENPMNQLAQVLQIQGIKQQQEARNLALQKENRLAQVLGQSYAKPEEREEALLRGGFIDQSTKLAKDRRDNMKTDADTKKTSYETVAKKLEIMGQTFGAVRANPTLESAMMALDYLGQNGAMEPQEVAQYKAQIQSDPSKIAALADQAFRATLDAKEQIAKYQTNNTGGQTVTQAIDPVTGKATLTSAIQNTQSPDNAASVAVQMRGQNMTDARARETLSATMTKPFEVTGEDGKPVLVQQDKQGNIRPVQGYAPKSGGKPMTEGQAKANLFGSRMKESDRILQELEGKYSPMAVNAKMGAEKLPGVGAVAGAVGNAMLSGEGQKAEQAQRDFVNAVLRRESGAVISDAEFANAQKQYFPQPNDKPENLAQKRRNRQMAIQGLEAEVPGGLKMGGAQPSGGATGGWDKSSPEVDALLKKYGGR